MSFAKKRISNARLTLRLALSALAMFGFGFLLVPLYDVFCEITGINGKTNTEAVALPINAIDLNREVTVEFITQGAAGGKWLFKPMEKRLRVHPGELHTAQFEVHNLTDTNLVVQAVPSVAPGLAANYLNKTECFCFNQQPLLPGEKKKLPLRFFVDAALPEEMVVMTLSYTLFDITEKVDNPEELFSRGKATANSHLTQQIIVTSQVVKKTHKESS